MDAYDNLETALRQLRLAEDAMRADDWLLACRALGRCAEAIAHMAPEFAMSAYDHGATKKDIALALNLRPSDLRGMERRVTS
jgi:hypothetical protein